MPSNRPSPVPRRADRLRPVVLVTGASTGIGADLARVFAEHGHDLALTARSAEKLHALADEIAAAGRPRPLVIPRDLSSSRAADEIADALAGAGARVAILVNNAGYGMLGAAGALDRHNQLGIVDVNVRALLDLTIRFLPDLEAGRGKILNVGSMASYLPGPGMAVYYASKHFVGAFSRALSEELRAAGVTVTLLNPGMTRSEFHARAGVRKPPGRRASSRSVAEAGYCGLMAGRRVVVPGLGNKLSALLLPLVPDAILLPMVHRFQKRR
jgi:uncharacterized protein